MKMLGIEANGIVPVKQHRYRVWPSFLLLANHLHDSLLCPAVNWKQHPQRKIENYAKTFFIKRFLTHCLDPHSVGAEYQSYNFYIKIKLFRIYSFWSVCVSVSLCLQTFNLSCNFSTVQDTVFIVSATINWHNLST